MTRPDDRSPQLVWTEAGEPRSGRYSDVYFSAEDGLAETRTVFLSGCGLPEAWEGRRHFTVAELGFGTGLNIAALLDLWRRHRPTNGRLHVFSVEGYPLGVDEARRALAAWPEISDATDALLARWPTPTPGFHRIDLPEFDAALDLAVGEVDWALGQWSGRADAWFLDGFAPSTNPDMWSEAVLDRIAERSTPDARIATFTVAGAVRRGLADRGFTVEKRPGHGRKRERLEARRTGTAPAPLSPSVAVIGAGIAGVSVARALAALGIRPVVLEADRPGAGASGFPAALVTPRFDLGDEAISSLFAQALERADALYDVLPGAVTSRGVLQLAATDRDARRFGRVPDQPIWPEGTMIRVDDTEASRIAREPVTGPGLSMTSAFVVSPRVIVPAWSAHAEVRAIRADRLEPSGGGWRVIDASGGIIAEVDRVVVCGGADLARLVPDLALSPVRGQANWVEDHVVSGGMAWGSYVAPTAQGGFLFGATHDRDDREIDVRDGDTDRNLTTLAARLPRLADTLAGVPILARAAIRATTRDRLPVAGAVEGQAGLFVLGGLGSRGFCLAPLLGEHVAALIGDLPSPLPADVAARITPSRAALAPLASTATQDEPPGQ